MSGVPDIGILMHKSAVPTCVRPLEGWTQRSELVAKLRDATPSRGPQHENCRAVDTGW